MTNGTDIYIISGKQKSFRVGAFTITADSVPDFDNWGWDDWWDCSDWMRWTQLNVTAYGREVALQKFIQQWGSQDKAMAPYNWCKYHSDFANYYKDLGVDVGWLFSKLIVALDNVGDDAIDVVEDTSDSATNLSSAVASITTIVKWVAPFAALGAGVWAIDKYVYPIFPKSKNRK